MHIIYYATKHKNGNSYIVLVMPKELVSQCNFNHKDRFFIDIKASGLSIKYDIGGNGVLSKSGARLVFNLNAELLDERVVKLLFQKEERILPIKIEGECLVVDFSQLKDRQKGFDLFTVPNKGFSLTNKE